MTSHRLAGRIVDKSTLPICCLLIPQPNLWAQKKKPLVISKPHCCPTKPKLSAVLSLPALGILFFGITKIKHDRKQPRTSQRSVFGI